MLGIGNVTINFKNPYPQGAYVRRDNVQIHFKNIWKANGSQHFGGKTAGKELDAREESSIK